MHHSNVAEEQLVINELNAFEVDVLMTCSLFLSSKYIFQAQNIALNLLLIGVVPLAVHS